MVTQRINLNLIPGGVLPRINVSQYDTGSRTLELVLYNGETAFNVPAGANVQIVGTKRDNTGFEYSCTYTDNVVSVDITDQMTVFGGEVVTELRILKDDDQLGTGNFIINVEPTALKDDVVISETDIPIIQQLPSLIAQAESSAELAHQWADYGDESDTPSATNNAKYWSIQAAAAAAGCLRPAIVQSLPTSDISTVTLYFVPSSDPDTGNLYDEYINTDGTSAGWELIGSTGVDLSAYLQKTGDSKDNTVTYTSADDDTVFNSGNLGGQSAYAWTAANSLASGEKHSVLFNKISTMLKNLRTIAKLIGTADISTIGTSPNTGTVTGAIAKINSDLSELRVIGSVTADGVKTVSQLLDTLFPLIKDNHRLAQSVLIMSDTILHPRQLNQNNLVYFNGNISNDVYVEIANIQASNSVYASKDASSGVVNMSSTVPTSGTVYKVCI